MKKFLLLVLFLCPVMMLFSQNLNLKGAGARAAGMGGAFIAIADDATAITWNPAGLSQLEKPKCQLLQNLPTMKLIMKIPTQTLQTKPHYHI